MQTESTTNSIAQHIDEAVRSFVVAWTQGPRPRIEQALEDWVGAGRNTLFLKLLNVEITLRQHRRAAHRVGISVALPRAGRSGRGGVR